MYFITDGRGRSLNSPFELHEARAILQNMPNPSRFAQDLCKPTNLTLSQIYWIHKLACDAQQAENPTLSPDMLTIVDLFKTAKVHLKKPRITFLLDNNEITLSCAPDNGNNPNHIYIKINGTYRGKITPKGIFRPLECDGKIINYLVEFAKNPIAKAKEYGKTTGVCCFCSLQLTDPRSVLVGYGPICAQHYALPWG